MKIETYCDEKGASTMKNVAYCDIHTPADSDVTPLISRVNDQTESDVVSGAYNVHRQTADHVTTCIH